MSSSLIDDKMGSSKSKARTVHRVFQRKPSICLDLLQPTTAPVRPRDATVYVRLASEHQVERIRRFEDDGITEDWLLSKNKSFYSHYKDGRFVKYPGKEDVKEAEANLIGEAVPPMTPGLGTRRRPCINFCTQFSSQSGRGIQSFDQVEWDR